MCVAHTLDYPVGSEDNERLRLLSNTLLSSLYLSDLFKNELRSKNIWAAHICNSINCKHSQKKNKLNEIVIS